MERIERLEQSRQSIRRDLERMQSMKSIHEHTESLNGMSWSDLFGAICETERELNSYLQNVEKLIANIENNES